MKNIKNTSSFCSHGTFHKKIICALKKHLNFLIVRDSLYRHLNEALININLQCWRLDKKSIWILLQETSVKDHSGEDGALCSLKDFLQNA
jgi:hypothetical protein